MALIKCPECGKEVSDKATACIHCGYPLNNNAISKVVVQPEVKKQQNIVSLAPMKLFSVNEEKVNIECGNCGKIYKYDKALFTISKESCTTRKAIICPNCKNGLEANTKLYGDTKAPSKISDDANVLKCPKCGSTAVTTGQRGFSLITGFLGSNKTVNRCGKCGHSWTPKK